MKRPNSTLRSLLIGTLVVLVGVTCTDGALTGPRSSRGLLARVGFAPAFSKAAAEILQNLEVFGFEVNNVHVHLSHANGTPAKDTVVILASGQDSVVIQMGVNLDATTETLAANIELRDDNTVLFSGTQSVTVQLGTTAPPAPPISVDYTGPGAGATSLTLAPNDTAVLAGDSVVYRPSAKNAAGQNLPNLALAWSVKDPSFGSVDGKGVFRASLTATRGGTYVMSRLLSGPRDSAHVNVTPAATKVVLVSGADQIGTVGKPLAQSIVVEAQAADNLAVPFVPLAFQAVSGGGSVSQATVFADANGRASVSLTLGTIAGANTLQVSSTKGTVTALLVSATGKADQAFKLGVLQQPSSAALSGTALAQQPSTKVLDQYGNVVAAPGLPVAVSLTSANGRTLGGTLTATTNSLGVAAFTDLKISGPPGTASLTFSTETLASAVSSNIAVAIGPPAALTLQGESSLALVAGASPAGAFVVRDAGGNGVANVDVRVVLTSGTTTVNDNTFKTDASGRVLLSGVPLSTVAGSYTITASSGSLSGSPVSVDVAITAAAASKLRFVQQPADGAAALTTLPVTVEILDQFNNRVTTGAGSTASVSLALSGGTVGAILGGSTTQAAVAGVATLSVSVDKAGAAYVLTASTATPALTLPSNAFSVGAGAAAVILPIAGNGAGLLKGEEVVLKAKVTDAGGNVVAAKPITFTVTSGGGLLNSSTAPFTTTTDASGLAVVDYNAGTAGTQTVQATSGAASFDFRVFIAETLVVVRQPSLNPQSGIAIPTQPKVQLQDLVGNQVKKAGVKVLASYSLEPPIQDVITTIAGTLQQVTDANGEATWTDLIVAGTTPQTGKLGFVHDVATPSINPAFSDVMTLAPGIANIVQPESGDPYMRFDPGTTVANIRVRVTDGFSPTSNVQISFFDDRGNCPVGSSTATTDQFGIASVDVSLPAAQASCAIRAQPTAVQNPAPEQTAHLRLYVVASGTPFWVGKTSSDWDDPTNWYAGLVPSPGSPAFIPASWLSLGLDQIPKISRDTVTLGALFVESSAFMDLNLKTIVLGADLAVDGFIIGGGTVIADGRSGAFRAGFIQALLKVSQNALYTVSGIVQVDSLELTGELTLDQDFGIAVSGDFRAKDNSQLFQSKGFIEVFGDATFDGQLASLTGGQLILGHNFTHNGACETRRFAATAAHTTHMFGDATADSLTFTWNGACTSRLGILQIATQGKNGVTLRSSTSQVLPLNSLLVSIGTALNIPTIFNIFLDSGGKLDLLDGTSLLRLDNILSLPTALSCGSGYLYQGDNVGPLSCTMP